MSKFIDSEEGIPQELIPFSAKSTQVMIKGIQEIKYSPINSFEKPSARMIFQRPLTLFTFRPPSYN